MFEKLVWEFKAKLCCRKGFYYSVHCKIKLNPNPVSSSVAGIPTKERNQNCQSLLIVVQFFESNDVQCRGNKDHKCLKEELGLPF